MALDSWSTIYSLLGQYKNPCNCVSSLYGALVVSLYTLSKRTASLVPVLLPPPLHHASHRALQCPAPSCERYVHLSGVCRSPYPSESADVLAQAYPLGRPPRILDVVEIAQSDARIALLRSPIPAFLPESQAGAFQPAVRVDHDPGVDCALIALQSSDDGLRPSITSREFATSFVTTLLGGGLALYFT